MKNYYSDILRTAVQALEIQDISCFSWFGKKEKILPDRLMKVLPATTARAHLINMIQAKLYANFYCRGYATPLRVNESTIPLVSSKTRFVSELQAANGGKGFSEGKWKIISIDEINAVVEKNGIRFSVNRKDCGLQNGDSLLKGNFISFSMPNELKGFSPGFYMALSDENFVWNNASTVVRLYWNLLPEGAAVLVKEITTAFNRIQIPFRLKTIDHPARFTRCDAAVIYLHKDQYARTRPILEGIYPKLMPYLKNEIPAFTKNLAVGLGLSEDPAHGSSFGMHRCAILAGGLVNAYEQGITNPDKRFEAVTYHFTEKKIDPQKPYLNPGSADIFGFSPGITSALRWDNKAAGNGHSDADSFQKTAMEIGHILMGKAIWHHDRCNWMGIDFYSNNLIPGEPSRLVFKALGPEVYAGTAGIALFLAELYKNTNEMQAKATSIAAMRQSLSAVHLLSSSAALGLHDGVTGIAFASAYIGALLSEEEFVDAAIRLLNDAIRRERKKASLDLISGNAGAIMVLLILSELWDDKSLLTYAILLGDELVRKSEAKSGYSSWRSPAFPKQQNLLGYSHGTSGIARALLELYRATNDETYRKTALSAFGYEDYWFNKEMNNWPDFRGIDAPAGKKYGFPEFPVFWCHGAAGIALSRLFAFKILDADNCRAEAVAALAITREWTKKMLAMRQANFSLCHGLAGNADILLQGFAILGEDCREDESLAMEIADAGIRMYAHNGHHWPLDVEARNAPGLMTGLSGVGHFYLRLHNNDIPSFLALGHQGVLNRLSNLKPEKPLKWNISVD